MWCCLRIIGCFCLLPVPVIFCPSYWGKHKLCSKIQPESLRCIETVFSVEDNKVPGCCEPTGAAWLAASSLVPLDEMIVLFRDRQIQLFPSLNEGVIQSPVPGLCPLSNFFQLEGHLLPSCLVWSHPVKITNGKKYWVSKCSFLFFETFSKITVPSQSDTKALFAVTWMGDFLGVYTAGNGVPVDAECFDSFPCFSLVSSLLILSVSSSFFFRI